MKNITQDHVVAWLDAQLGTAPPQRGQDNRGPDRVYQKGKTVLAIEAIGFTETVGRRGQNQLDFWKAFGQAISRLNKDSAWEKVNAATIALPYRFAAGWTARTREVGEDVWKRIGTAFPELEIWFVSSKQVERYSWNDAFAAKPNIENL